MATKKLKWTKAEIKEMLEKSDKALIRGLMTIYGYQTDEERNTGHTVEDNGMGFNGADAELLTQFALFYSQNNYLTPGQITWARKKMLKYAGQLANHANIHNPKKA
jgi:hypothetical protein